MLRFLFWNTGARDVSPFLKNMVGKYSIDFVVLAETSLTRNHLPSLLSNAAQRQFHIPASPCEKLTIATSLNPHSIQPVYDEDSHRVTIRRLILESTDLLLVAVHLPSKLHWRDHDLPFEAQRVAGVVREIEDSFGHRRTVVVGDFNMDPFESGLVASHAFHGLMTRQLANRESRVVNAQRYPCFYNPMWRFFGDRDVGRPSGTYFHRGSTPTSYFWHMFDLVLVRSELVPALSDVQILTDDGSQSLADDAGFPDDNLASDHFPLLFELSL
jgi:endonuclease/exonuclease/phosphatase family metal-dependent hydrolase